MQWLIVSLLLIACGVLSIVLLACVQWGLQQVYLIHARRFCRKSGLVPTRWRSGTAFDAAGIKTEFTIVELECRDLNGEKKFVRLLVWIFGVRQVLEAEQQTPAPPRVSQELLPQVIPYNPGLGYVALLLGFSIFLFTFGLFLRWPVFVVAVVCLLFRSQAALMHLRRTLWPRQILLTENSITIPSGFLRLWPTTINYSEIEFVSVAVLPGGILCVQTARRNLEILGTFLPDQHTVELLHQHLSSFVRPSSWDETN